MRDVDLGIFVFDYDLTFAALLMNADGTIYHTFAGRDAAGPSSHQSITALTKVMRETLAEHERYRKRPDPPKPPGSWTVRDSLWMSGKIREGKAPKCFHCHMVYDGITWDLRDRSGWKNEYAFRWPDPIQLGLVLDGEDQVRVTRVVEGSPAEGAGIRKGDRLRYASGKRLLTFGDVQRVLQELPRTATGLRMRLLRDGVEKTVVLKLGKDWKTPTPETFAWRASKWPLSPKPGFGGRPLDAAQKKAAGVGEDRFAFKVGYLVTWGENAHTGRNAAKAGIRKGDVVLSVDGRDDFRDMNHFHAWFRLKQVAGRKIPVVLLRGGKRRTLTLPVVD